MLRIIVQITVQCKYMSYCNDVFVFSHENASGYYSVSVYFIAKVTVDMFALRLIPNTALALVTYFMVGEFVEREQK